MRNPPSRQKPIIARGPEMKFRPGTWQSEHYRGRPMYEHVQDGQYFPEGATQKQLDALALQRRDELAGMAAAQAAGTVVELELSKPAPEPEVSVEQEAVAV